MSDRFLIVRDTREKSDFGYHFQADNYCAGTMVKKVDVGDYTIRGLEDFVCIERKRSVDEFAKNITEDRFLEQLKKMKEIRFKFIIFEFSMNDVEMFPASSKAPIHLRQRIRIHPNFIKKRINQCRNDYNIHVLFCNNRILAEHMTYRILKKAYDIHRRRQS